MRFLRTAVPLALLFLLLAGAGCGRDSSRDTGTEGTAAGEDATDSRLTDVAYLRSLPPSAETDIQIGNVFLVRGELDSALVAFRSATERDPQSVAAWNYLGICLTRMERYAEASDAYHAALDLDAFHLETHINLGNLHLWEDDLDAAVNEYVVASTIDSTDARIWRNLGLAYVRQGKDNPAILAYRKAEALDPDDPVAPKRMGWIYYNNDLYSGALECWQRALLNDPADPELIDNVQAVQAFLDSTRVQ